jgi:hypothetical protein
LPRGRCCWSQARGAALHIHEPARVSAPKTGERARLLAAKSSHRMRRQLANAKVSRPAICQLVVTRNPTLSRAQRIRRPEGCETSVIQRTDDGFSRAAARNPPDGETHTSTVDVSCDGEGKCVEQVEEDQRP